MSFPPYHSINRIRLEFKAASLAVSAFDAATVLIESDWNLKTIDGAIIES